MAEPDSIESLLTGTSRAVLAAQRRLDTELSPHYSSHSTIAGRPLEYAIPRVAVETEFALEQRQTGRLLWVFPGRGRSDVLTHCLRFRLTAVPERPSAPVATADTPLSSACLWEPHMLVSGDEERRISLRVAAALEAGTFRPMLPGSSTIAPQLARREAGRIRAALTARDPERGMVAFRLDDPPGVMLVIRVTEKGVHDGVFVVDEVADSPVLVYSLEEDGAHGVRYKPLHDFVRTVRNWQSGLPARRRPVAPGDLNQLGLVGLEEFAAALESGYSATLKFLAEDAPATSSFYALSDVEADLNFAVHFDEQNALHMEIERRLDPAGDESATQASVVSCRVGLRAHCRDGVPVLDLDLAQPEFIVSGAGRAGLLEKMQDAAVDIAAVLGSGGALPPARYESLFRNPALAKEAVIFLAYQGKKPREEFLVIWPGAFEGRGRDIVFTCKLTNGKIGEVRSLMRLDQPLGDVQLGIDGDGDLARDQYTPFHNAFHAVRIWRARLPS
jgi:hypothetical protein